MDPEISWVCCDCGDPLACVQSHEDPRLTTWECPTHGERGFFLDLGKLDLDAALAAAQADVAAGRVTVYGTDQAFLDSLTPE